MKTCDAPITARQQAILDFIRRSPRAPTVREIGREFGINSPNGVCAHLKALERKGLINRDPRKSRNIEIVGAPSVETLRHLLSGEDIDGSEITIGGGRYRLQYLRPATPEEME